MESIADAAELEPQPNARTFYIYQLVRINIPLFWEASKYDVQQRSVVGEELITLLEHKLDEEVAELEQAITAIEVLEELADIHQVISDLHHATHPDESYAIEGTDSFMRRYSIDEEMVEQRVREKAERNGGFIDDEGGVFVRRFTVPDDVPATDEWLSYFLANPEKYPTTPPA